MKTTTVIQGHDVTVTARVVNDKLKAKAVVHDIDSMVILVNASIRRDNAAENNKILEGAIKRIISKTNAELDYMAAMALGCKEAS